VHDNEDMKVLRILKNEQRRINDELRERGN